jgi:hypothetical protein
MAGITNTVSKHKSAGLEADYEIGEERLAFVPPVRRIRWSGLPQGVPAATTGASQIAAVVASRVRRHRRYSRTRRV